MESRESHALTNVQRSPGEQTGSQINVPTYTHMMANMYLPNSLVCIES